MVDGQGLTGVLDWEFAGWGDPMSDLGWFCAECWRFGRPELEAGGISARADFYRGYEAGGDGAVDDAAVRYWEIVAHLRWAVVALEQGGRHLSGLEPSLELALTGRIVPELEAAVLRTTGPEAWHCQLGGLQGAPSRGSTALSVTPPLGRTSPVATLGRLRRGRADIEQQSSGAAADGSGRRSWRGMTGSAAPAPAT